MSLALTILSLPRSDLLPAALLRNQLSSIQYHRLNPPFQNGNLHSVLMVLVKQSVVIQCPPLGSFSHQADPTTDSLFDGSFVRSFGRSVGRSVCAAAASPLLPSLTFPLRRAAAAVGAADVAIQREPHAPKSAREHR